jgi:hypothetical protein
MRAYLSLLAVCLLLSMPFSLSPATAAPPHATAHAKTKHVKHHAKPARHQTAKKKNHAAHHHRHATARRHRPHGMQTPPHRVGLLLRLDSPLGQAVVNRPGTIAIVREAVGNADFIEGQSPQYNTLTGMQMEMAGNGSTVRAIGYFGLTMPPATELTDFNLIQELPPLLNTATGQVEHYGEFVARTDITNPHVWARLGKEHAARAAAHQKERQQRQSSQAAKNATKHKPRTEKHPPVQRVVKRMHPNSRRPAMHLPHTSHPPQRPIH